MLDAYSYRSDPDVPAFEDSAPIAVMDAECAVCTRGARLIHRLDRTGTIRICPVQTPLGAALMAHSGLAPDDPASWLYLEDGEIFEGAEAVLRIAARMGGAARFALILRLVPRALREGAYRVIARNRYRLFGRADMCAFPDPDFQARLLR